MGKTWDTKKKILKILSKKTMTPTEVSQTLGLAPSTVVEHLAALEKMGAITHVENPYIKRWKYYKANPEFEIKKVEGVAIMSMTQVVRNLAIVLGLIVILTLGVQAFSTGSNVSFALTDPPQVPAGTQALNVTYSSIQAHVINGNSSTWVSGSGSGSLNLMSLINTSTVIGSGKISANSIIDMVRFSITSANMVINGTSYPVTVPSGQLTAKVTGSSKTAANSSILIDLSPVVVSVYTQNSTDFVLVPSVKAIYEGAVRLQTKIGMRTNLSDDERFRLASNSDNLTIQSASLSVVGNTTTKLTITVKDNGNENITLRHVILYGNPAVVVSANSLGKDEANSTLEVNLQQRPMMIGLNGSVITDLRIGNYTANGLISVNATTPPNKEYEVENNVHVMIKSHGGFPLPTQLAKIAANFTPGVNSLITIGVRAKLFKVLNFFVAQNGTLTLPFAEEEPNQGFGYVLKPGATATLTFSGPILFANGHMRIAPVVGQNFTLVVGGDGGAFTTTHLTATSG